MGCSDVTHSTADICLYAGEWVDVSPPPDLLPLLSLCRGLERSDKEDICRMLPLLHNLPQDCKHNVSILCTSLALFSNGQKQQMRWWGWGGSILFRDIFTIPSYLIQFALAEVISKGSKTSFCWHYIYAPGKTYRFICTAQAKQDSPYLE